MWYFCNAILPCFTIQNVIYRLLKYTENTDAYGWNTLMFVMILFHFSRRLWLEYLNVCNDIVSFFLDAYGWNTVMFVTILFHFSYIFYMYCM